MPCKGRWPLPRRSYRPDGAWAEGPGYWSYATKYTVTALAGLQSAPGTDYGLSTLPGPAGAARSGCRARGPTGLFFNFAEAGERAGDEPALFWLARRLTTRSWPGGRGGRRSGGSSRRSGGTTPGGRKRTWPAPGLDAHPCGRRRGRLALRLERDRQAIYVGFKGGRQQGPTTPTSIWAPSSWTPLGQRWATDLVRG